MVSLSNHEGRVPGASFDRLRMRVVRVVSIARNHLPRLWAIARSPAGDAHVAGDGGLLGTPVDDEVVALGLARYGLVYGASK